MQMFHDKIEAEIDHITMLGQIAKDVCEPDLKGFLPSLSITGKFKKHYQYDKYNEVYVDLYENGALLYKAGSVYEWYGKGKVSKCFEKAKILGSRSKSLNKMFGG